MPSMRRGTASITSPIVPSSLYAGIWTTSFTGQDCNTTGESSLVDIGMHDVDDAVGDRLQRSAKKRRKQANAFELVDRMPLKNQVNTLLVAIEDGPAVQRAAGPERSEERRVGKEGRSR